MKERSTARSWRSQERAVGYGLVLPDVFGLLLFLVVPSIAAVVLSFYRWTGLSDPSFAGLENYQALLTDSNFLRSLVTTATFTIVYVIGLYVLSLGLAIIVNQRMRANGFFRSAYFLAALVSPAVAAIVWTFVFDERGGLLNAWATTLGLDPVRWLGDPDSALIAVAVVAVWQAASFTMIIQLAGLQDIPREYYEAAGVDGAGAWTKFRHLTMPLLRPTTAFVVITAVISGLQVFDIVYVMTHGGPARATTTTVYYIYQTAFEYLNVGYACAMSVVLFTIIFVIALLLLRLLRQHSPD